MKKEVRLIVITGYGTNGEMEMAHACRLAGPEEEGMGVAFFKNAVQYIRTHLL
jgi:hypothetical protein